MRILLAILALTMTAADWPRWRGPGGNAVSTDDSLPLRWGPRANIGWKTALPGEGSSSPIVWGERVFVTAARKQGGERLLHCLDRQTGKLLWSRGIEDKNPETTSALTGHAASTPATDGKHIVAWFGNAGVVCHDFQGTQLWQRKLGEFESELGLASSPIMHEGKVFLVCDHDGSRFTSFDSYLLALDVKTGRQVWKTERPKFERSWSTPIIVPGKDGKPELVVSAQDGLRGYDPATGKPLWHVKEEDRWVTPSPVFGHGLIFAASGKDGPIFAARPGGRGEQKPVWQHERGGPYVCSPILLGDHLYVIHELGFLTCFEARTGKRLYRERLAGKFTASPVAAPGRLYFSNEAGDTYVIKAGAKFALLAKNSLGAPTLASPALAAGQLFLRTEKHLFRISVKE